MQMSLRRIRMAQIGIVGIGNMGLGHGASPARSRPSRAGARHRPRARGYGATAWRQHRRRCGSGVRASRAALIVAVVDAAQTRAVLFGEAGAAPWPGAGSGRAAVPDHRAAGCRGHRRCSGGARRCRPSTRRCPAARQRARDGSMSLMVACADSVFERWRPLLADLSAAVPRRHAARRWRAHQARQQPAGGDQPGGRRGGHGAGAAIGLDAATTLAVIEHPAARAGSAASACAARWPVTAQSAPCGPAGQGLDAGARPGATVRHRATSAAVRPQAFFAAACAAGPGRCRTTRRCGAGWPKPACGAPDRRPGLKIDPSAAALQAERETHRDQRARPAAVGRPCAAGRRRP